MFSFRLKLILLLAQAICGQASYIGGIPAAGLLGSYAGALSGGEALSKLDLGASSHDEYTDHEQLTDLSAHLSEHSFPADYGSSDGGEEYAEASEHHEHHYEPEELEDHHHHDHDHHEEPVPGIDHGKGAFSYSTLYEFKDREEHEQHQLEHQLEEQHVEQQLELEHQIHMLDNHHHHQLDLH